PLLPRILLTIFVFFFYSSVAHRDLHSFPTRRSSDLSAYPQYWNRNTLVVDLAAASGSGSITLKPAAGSAWPVRLAFRVTPGSVGLLSVRGDQRLVIPITPAAGKRSEEHTSELQSRFDLV